MAFGTLAKVTVTVGTGWPMVSMFQFDYVGPSGLVCVTGAPDPLGDMLPRILAQVSPRVTAPVAEGKALCGRTRSLI